MAQLDSLHKSITGWCLLFVIAIAPIYKYGEYVYNFPRINATLIVSLLLLLAVATSIQYLRSPARCRFSSLETLTGFLIIYIVLLQLVQIPFLLQEIEHLFLLTNLANTLIYPLALILAGLQIQHFIANFRHAIIIFWAAQSVIYFHNSTASDRFFLYLDGELIYLMLANAYAFLSILTIYLLRHSALKIAVFFISSAILYALLSRAALYLFIVTYVIYMIYHNKHWLFALLPITIITILLMLLGDFNIIANLDPSNRMFRILLGASDSSMSGREYWMDAGLVRLKEHWLLGRYMNEVVATGQTGTYIHNILSYWSAYGILPFFLFLLVLMTLMFKFYKMTTRGYNVELPVIMLFLTITSIIVAKSYTYYYIWLAIGVGLAHIRQANPRRQMTKSIYLNPNR